MMRKGPSNLGWLIICIIMCSFILVCHIYSKKRESKVQQVDETCAGCDVSYLADDKYTNTLTKGIKIIYGASLCFGKWQDKFNFTGCSYSNCVVQSCAIQRKYLERADVVLISNSHITISEDIPSIEQGLRSKQRWLLVTHESPAWQHNQFKAQIVEGKFNGGMTYRRDSHVYFPYHRFEGQSTQPKRNYAAGKTKAAFAYVSNCQTHNYNRLKLIRSLSKYIQVDIYGGCTRNYPCKYRDYECEDKLHKQYRFFLSFENSLCKDYITEKFWSRLYSSSVFLPVVIGGVSVEDYTSITPPDSFLHVFNFSTVEDLGNYMSKLMNNDAAYNKYHEWRHSDLRPSPYADASCRLCEVANLKPSPVMNSITSWWNAETVCRDYKF